MFDLDKKTFNDLFSGYVLDAELINDRGVKVSLAQMKSLAGTFVFIIPPAYYVATVVVIGVGALALSWQNNHHYKSPKKSIPKPHNHWRPYNKIHFPRYVKYPNSGRNGYKPKYNYHPVTSYLSGNKHYANHKASLYKYNVKRGSVNSYNVAEIAYQEAYNYYLSTKNKERNKLSMSKEDESTLYFEKAIRKFKYLDSSPGTPEGNQSMILDGLFKFSKKNFNKGSNLIKEGKYFKGVAHIIISLWAVDIGIMTLALNLFPKEFFKK